MLHDKSCRTCSTMSHIDMTHFHVSRETVRSHTYMSHVSPPNESCLTPEWVMSHRLMGMGHVRLDPFMCIHTQDTSEWETIRYICGAFHSYGVRVCIGIFIYMFIYLSMLYICTHLLTYISIHICTHTNTQLVYA